MEWGAALADCISNLIYAEDGSEGGLSDYYFCWHQIVGRKSAVRMEKEQKANRRKASARVDSNFCPVDV